MRNNRNIRNKLLRLPLLFLVLLLSCRGQGAVDDWPQWRGADRSGSWSNGPSIDTLTENMIRLQWEVPIGPGYSGPTVADGRVYVMDYVKGSEQVHCFSAENGERQWSYRYPVTYNVGYPTGPRASVQVFGGKAYSFGTMGHLHCFDAATGRIIWQVNALEQYQSRLPTWGLASNPIMVDDKLIVQLGGVPGACMVAFDKDSGAELWRALEDEASYSAPILITQSGKEVLVCWTGESISGLDPVHGEVCWSLPFQPGNMVMNIADPVYDPPYIFLSGFFDGSYLVELDQENLSARLIYHRQGASEQQTDALHCCISTPVIRDGYVYGIDSYGETRCLELLTGDRIWEDLTLVPPGRWANVHLVSQGDKVWAFNELGELLLGKFSPTGFSDLGRVRLISPVRISPNPRNGVCWAHPAFVGNRVFVRSDEKLVCIQINNP